MARLCCLFVRDAPLAALRLVLGAFLFERPVRLIVSPNRSANPTLIRKVWRLLLRLQVFHGFAFSTTPKLLILTTIKEGERFTVHGGERFTVDNFCNTEGFQQKGSVSP